MHDVLSALLAAYSTLFPPIGISREQLNLDFIRL